MRGFVTIISIGFVSIIGCGQREHATSEHATETVTTAPASPRNAAASPAAGEPIPMSLRLTTAEGQPTSLAEIEGNALLLNLWATWCAPCRVEIPDLIAIQSEYRDRGLTIVGISVDDRGMEAEVRAFAEEQKINYPIILDPRAEIAEHLNASVIPTSVLIDRNGTIVWKHIGIVREGDQKLEQAIAMLLDV